MRVMSYDFAYDRTSDTRQKSLDKHSACATAPVTIQHMQFNYLSLILKTTTLKMLNISPAIVCLLYFILLKRVKKTQLLSLPCVLFSKDHKD